MSSTIKTVAENTQNPGATAQTQALSQRITAAVVGGTLGLFILLGVAFASPDLIHNATHDTRHAGTFPCH